MMTTFPKWMCLGVVLLELSAGNCLRIKTSAGNNSFYDIDFIFNLTQHLYTQHGLENFVTFASNRRLQLSPISTDLIVRSLDRRLMEDLNMPLIICGLDSNMSLHGLVTRHTVILASIEHLSTAGEPMLEVIHQTLKGRHDLRILFVLKGKELPTQLQVKQFFTWCWRRKFINVALTFQQLKFWSSERFQVKNELHSYTPFPELKVLNVTQEGMHFNWELIEVSNVQGHEFRVPVFRDLLTAYQLPSGELYGAFGLLLAAYIDHINGTLRVDATPHVDRHNYHETTLLAAEHNDIGIGVHVYTQMTLNSELAEGASTSILSSTCLMVPWQQEAHLDRVMRYNIALNSILLIVVMVFMPWGWHHWADDGWRGFLYALATFCMQSVEERVFRRLYDPYKFIHLGVLMGVFVMWNMRVAHLSSRISTIQRGPQINTAEDLLQAPIRIMLTETEVAMYFSRRLLPMQLQSRFHIVNSSTLIEHRDNLNTSYAYCITEDNWQLIEQQQKGLSRPLFRLASPDLCTPQFIKLIPVQRNSPFRRQFSIFYNSMWQFGLFHKWHQLSYMRAKELGLVRILHDEKIQLASLSLRDLTLPLSIFAAHTCCCLLALAGELLWHRRMLQQAD